MPHNPEKSFDINYVLFSHDYAFAWLQFPSVKMMKTL